MGRIRAKYDDPTGAHHGIPTFYWRGAPPGYATRRQLRAAGLRPGGQGIAAQIKWRGLGGERTAYLYHIDHAKPKRTATPRVLAALDKALRARKTCGTCGQVKTYFIRTKFDECAECVESAGGCYAA